MILMPKNQWVPTICFIKKYSRNMVGALNLDLDFQTESINQAVINYKFSLFLYFHDLNMDNV